MIRDPLDRDYTPLWAARAATKTMLSAFDGEAEGMHFHEGHAGGGSFLLAMQESMCGMVEVTASDIDTAAPAVIHGKAEVADFLRLTRTMIGEPDVIFGNPPYKYAEDHVYQGMHLARHTFFLLRLNFLGSRQRVPLFVDSPNLRQVWTFCSRPSFRADGKTDATEYALFWWDTEHEGPYTGWWIYDEKPNRKTRLKQQAYLDRWLRKEAQ